MKPGDTAKHIRGEVEAIDVEDGELHQQIDFLDIRDETEVSFNIIRVPVQFIGRRDFARIESGTQGKVGEKFIGKIASHTICFGPQQDLTLLQVTEIIGKTGSHSDMKSLHVNALGK